MKKFFYNLAILVPVTIVFLAYQNFDVTSAKPKLQVGDEGHENYRKGYPSLITVDLNSNHMSHGGWIVQASVHSRQDVTDATFSWQIPEGAKIKTGDLTGRTDLKANEESNFEIELDSIPEGKPVFLEVFYFDDQGAKIGGIGQVKPGAIAKLKELASQTSKQKIIY